MSPILALFLMLTVIGFVVHQLCRRPALFVGLLALACVTASICRGVP